MKDVDAAVDVWCFLVAGACQVAGCYLVWQAVRGVRRWGDGLIGAAMLLVFGFLIAHLPAPHTRVYTAFAGVFIILSMLLAWLVEGPPPNRKDARSAAVVAAALLTIFLAVRAAGT